MTWWLWLVLGLALLATELLVPGGLFLLFFGCGAIIVGLLTMAGVLSLPWLEWMLFAVFSLGLLLLFRAKLLLILGRAQSNQVDSYEGESAIVTEAMTPGAFGKVELRGAGWRAQNVGETALTPGSRVRVQRVDGLTVIVSAEI